MNTPNPTNPRMSIAAGKVNVTKMCKKILQVVQGYSDADLMQIKPGSDAAKDLHNLMNVFRHSGTHVHHGRSTGFKTGHGMKMLEKFVMQH